MREESFELGKLEIRLRAQKHPGGSAGIRLDNRLAYLTDTQLDLAAEQFIQGVELLLHEVWLTDQEAQQDKTQLENHSLASGVADLALAAGVPQLMPVHLHPRRTGDAIEKLAADMKRDGLDVVVPREGQTYWVG